MQASMKHRRRLIVMIASAAVAASALLLWTIRSESAAALVAREGNPWLVAKSAAVEYRYGSALLPSKYLVLSGVREWNPAVDPEAGTTLVYTADESVRVYWQQRVGRGGGNDEWFVLGSEPRFRCIKIDAAGQASVEISQRFFNIEVSGHTGAY